MALSARGKIRCDTAFEIINKSQTNNMGGDCPWGAIVHRGLMSWVAIVQGAIVQGAIVLGGDCPVGANVRGQLSRGRLSWVAIVLGRLSGGRLSRGRLSGYPYFKTI